MSGLANGNGKSYWLVASFLIPLLVLCCPSPNYIIPKADATSGTNQTFIDDAFGTGLSGWQYYGNPGYQLSLDSSTGVPAPSAHISGDAYLGNCSAHGMSKVVDLSSYSGGTLTLGLNWRASSSGGSTTEAAVSIDDADTGSRLFLYQLAHDSSSPDTSWQYYSVNIANYVPADKKIQVNLFLYDCWQANYDENNWYDNISLVWNNSPVPPNAPTGLNATVASPSQVDLSWIAPAVNGGLPITGYKIERSTDFGFTWSTLVTDTNSTGTSYSDTGLQSQYYTYRVSAINAIGTGPPSKQTTANPSGGKTTEYSTNSNFTGTVNASDTVIVDKGVTLTSNGIANYGYIRNMGTIQVNNTKSIDNHFFIFNTPGAAISAGVINNYKAARITNENSVGVGTINNYGIYNGTVGPNGYVGLHLNNYGTYYGPIGAYYGYISNFQTGVIESNNSGQIYNGELTNYGLIDSHGSITLTCSGISTNGTFNNYATISLFSAQCGSGITNGVGGTFNNFAGSEISIPTRTGGYGYEFYNGGTVNNNGTFQSYDLISNSGVFNNNGTVYLHPGGYYMHVGTVKNSGFFNNEKAGAINNSGYFDNECKSAYNNTGTFSGNALFGDCTTNQVIEISPARGPTGTQVTVSGNNLAPSHNIAVTFDHWSVPTVPSTIASNSTGGFTATFLVPQDTYYGVAFSPDTSHSVSETDGSYSATASFLITAPPSAPQNLHASPASISQINLSWAAPANSGSSAITGYEIARSIDNGTTWSAIVPNTGSTTTTYSDKGLAGNTTYTYSVSAINTDGSGPASNAASATTPSTTATAPQPPTGLGSVAVSPSQISLSWSAPSNDGGSAVTGYMVERSTDGGFTWSTTASNTGSTSTTYSDTGLYPSTAYAYRVSAINPVGTSGPSNTASATTSAGQVTISVNSADLCGNQITDMSTVIRYANGTTIQESYTPASFNVMSGAAYVVHVRNYGSNVFSHWNNGNTTSYYAITPTQNTMLTAYYSTSTCSSGATSTAPGAPTGLAATAASSSQVNLSWTAPSNSGSSAITGYKIERSTDSGTSWSAIQSNTGSTSTTYSDSGLAASTTYTYRVSAINSAGTSTPSSTAAATTLANTPPTVPSAPLGLVASASSSSQIHLSWAVPASNGGSPVTGYEIEQAKGNLSFGGFSNSTDTNFFSSGNTTTFSDTGLAPTTTYNYTVFAKNSVGSSQHSNTASATTSATTSGIVINNVQSTSGTTTSNQITMSSFNAGTGTNSLLVVGVSANNAAVTSVTFGGVQLTKAVSSFNNNDAEFWYLKSPTGDGNIVVTMSGSTSAVVGAYLLSGVDQSSPMPTISTSSNTASGSPSISITAKYANSLILDLPSIYGGKTLSSPSCTQEWDTNIPGAITGASSSTTVSSPSSVTCKWTASNGGDLWDDVAVEIKSSG